MATTATLSRDDSTSLRTDTLATGIVVLLGFTVLQRLVGFGRGLFFCRWLDAESLGEWDLALSFLLLASPVVVLSLPSAFGRYLEQYRRRGQLEMFLRRTAAFTIATITSASLLLWVFRSDVSRLIFGTSNHTTLVMLLIVALVGTVAYAFVTQLFTALRMQRIASMLHLLNSLLFAGLSTSLLFAWQAAVRSIVVAYAASCFATFLVALLLVARNVPLSHREASTSRGKFWSRILPFVFTVWLTDWVTNLFAITDRYMIVHFSGLSSADALAVVGQYHVARFIPLVFVQIAGLLATVFMPYLVLHWESGDQRVATFRLNLMLKGLGISLLAAAMAVSLGSSFIFKQVFQGKFAAGEIVLPGVLAFCCWAAMALVARTFLWCTKRPLLVTLSYLGGLAVNVALNAMLLPRFGLSGAVWATAAGTCCALGFILLLSTYEGWMPDGGTCVACLLPAAPLFGAQAAVLVFATVVLLCLGTNHLLNQQDKRQVVIVMHGLGMKLAGCVDPRRVSHSAPLNSRRAK